MRSFLIRDILSGAASANNAGAGPLTGALDPTSASSSFDCNQLTAQSLAATQARFLAKWAEHQQQQQLEASKYFEQVQQQQQTNLNLSNTHLAHLNQQQQQQLLNSLNLNHHHHLQAQHHQGHPHGLSLQLQLQQQAAIAAALGPAGMAAAAAAAAAVASSHRATTNDGRHPSESSSKPATAAVKLENRPNITTATSGGSNEPTSRKKPSFEYDCTSPISTISDRSNRIEEEDDEQDGEETDEDEAEDGEEIEVDGDNDDTDKAASSSAGTGKRHGSDGNNNHNDQTATSSSLSTTPSATEQQNPMQLRAQFQLNSPLDALFQMTSSTFDALKRGEKRKASDSATPTSGGAGGTGFTAKQNAKKKRKSRTAFTNSQIYELERRFQVQKYLSPTDRDEIAMTLNLSNAQVITWFQNRRAKMKRDQEEQRRDIETAALLNMQKHIFETYHALANKIPSG